MQMRAFKEQNQKLSCGLGDAEEHWTVLIAMGLLFFKLSVCLLGVMLRRGGVAVVHPWWHRRQNAITGGFFSLSPKSKVAKMHTESYSKPSWQTGGTRDVNVLPRSFVSPTVKLLWPLFTGDHLLEYKAGRASHWEFCWLGRIFSLKRGKWVYSRPVKYFELFVSKLDVLRVPGEVGRVLSTHSTQQDRTGQPGVPSSSQGRINVPWLHPNLLGS